MEANPYVMLVDALAGGAPADALVLGKVLSPEPLRVLAEGNTLGPERLLLNAALKKDYEIPAEIRDPKGDEHPDSLLLLQPQRHDRDRRSSGRMQADPAQGPDYKAGDLLLLLPIEGRQRYIAICRVVTP